MFLATLHFFLKPRSRAIVIKIRVFSPGSTCEEGQQVSATPLLY